MSMRLKIYGKKTENNSGENLCSTCRAHSKIKTYRQEVFLCNAFKVRLHDPVLECSNYNDARITSLGELHDQAWMWVGELKKFVSPQEYTRLRFKDPEPIFVTNVEETVN